MTAEDVPAVNALEQRLFPVDAWPLQMFLDELAQPETRRYLVAESGGEIVGYAGLMCIEPIADVQTIAVVPEFEGQGHRLGPADRLIGEAGGAARRTSCWRSARTTPAPSSCTCASASNRSTSAPVLPRRRGRPDHAAASSDGAMTPQRSHGSEPTTEAGQP